MRIGDALNPADADDALAYTLDSAMPREKPTVYSKPVPLNSATYDAAAGTVTLVMGSKLIARTMQLTINAADWLDAAGRPLDRGDDAYTGGGVVATMNRRRLNRMARTMADARASRVTATAIDALPGEGILSKRTVREFRHRRGCASSAPEVFDFPPEAVHLLGITLPNGFRGVGALAFLIGAAVGGVGALAFLIGAEAFLGGTLAFLGAPCKCAVFGKRFRLAARAASARTRPR